MLDVFDSADAPIVKRFFASSFVLLSTFRSCVFVPSSLRTLIKRGTYSVSPSGIVATWADGTSETFEGKIGV